MDSAEIEHLISEAINNRPKETNAPLNLYINKRRLICGTRIAMPAGAVFVAHVTYDKLLNGFDARNWQAIIEKIKEFTKTATLRGAAVKQSDSTEQEDISKSYERRREQRLYYRRPIYYTSDTDQSPTKAVMFDIASGGIAFTCSADKKHLSAGQDISTSFSVPRFGSDDSLSLVNFDRIGRICRVIKKQDYLHQIAVQFSNKLPFKPGEQGVEPIKTTAGVLVRS